MLAILTVVFMANLSIAAAAPRQVGSIAGCASEITGGRLPGTTIVAKGGDVERTAVTDASGCYTLDALPYGVYRVTARLAAFDNVTRDRVAIDATAVTRSVNFTLRLSAICECVRLSRSLAEHWNHADAVVYLRLAESESPLPAPQGYYRHAATLISVLKAPERGGTDITSMMQNQRSGAPPPYDAGQVLVAFLERSDDGFRIANDTPPTTNLTAIDDPALVFLVKAGRVERTPPEFKRYVGMEIQSFLKELRAIPRR